MLNRRTSGGGLLAVALVASALSGMAGPGVASAQPPASDAPAVMSAAGVQVTLVTGDHVTVSTTGAVGVQPGAGRGGIQFTTYREADGHTHVIPSDAVPMLSAGTLDRQLFDVTVLAASAYNSPRGELPLIVKQAPNARSAARNAIVQGGATIGRDMASLGFVAVRSRNDRATAFWNQITTTAGAHRKLRPEIGAVWLDRVYKPSLDHSVAQVGAPTAWAAGYDGTGVKVAVLDTGIDATHPDLSGKVIAAQNFTVEANTNDMFGHGTHVASIVAGSGAASAGQYKGVAPGASLLNGKVCVAAGNGSCMMSWLLAGMEWAAQQGADVVNMSLSGSDSDGVDPAEEAVNTLTATYGTLFVASAGNTPGTAADFSVGSPGTADSALSVGAVDSADGLAAFSNRGPRVGDTALKPDLTAPGVAIMAARSATGVLGEPDSPYVRLSGTSMASPHVAGAAAILVQRQPTWAPAQLKAALMGAADPNAQLSAFQQGAGRLNIGRGYNQTVLADRPSISLGRQIWPHEDDPVVTRTVTYTNTGSSDVTLNLSLNARDPNGAAAPDGMFTLGASSLNLAPGASAPVTFTATTSVAGPDGFYGGHIVATGGGDIQVSTAFGVDRSVEGYEVTVNEIDRGGAQAGDYFTILLPVTPGLPAYVWSGGSAATKFIRKGVYLVQSSIYQSGAAGNMTSVMVIPKLRVTEARSVTFDARTAGQVNVGVSDDALEQPYTVEVGNQLADGDYTTAISSCMQGAVFIGQTDPQQREAGYTSKVNATLARPGPGGDLRNSPRSYHLASFFEQNLPTGWAQSFRIATLARVNASIGGSVPGAMGYKTAYVYPGVGRYGASGQQFIPFDQPFAHTEYYNAGSNLRWQPLFIDQIEATGQLVVSFEGGLNSYVAGAVVAESWNKPVIGPAVGMAVDSYRWVVRQGNYIYTDPLLFGDSAGHPGRAWLVDAGQLVLRRNGSVVGSSQYPTGMVPSFEVPSGYAAYQLEVNAERAAPVVLSTRVNVVWTFYSDTMGGSQPVRLPLWSVSFRPDLNAANVAPAGRSFAMPATIAAQPNSTAAGLKTVTVQFSTDDGATWTAASVAGSGGSRTVTVTHPNITGFVSLRAIATDYAGNSVEQTVIRAYKIAP